MSGKMFGDVKYVAPAPEEELPHLEVGDVVEFLSLWGPRMVVCACWGPKNGYAVDVFYMDKEGRIQKCSNIDERILNWVVEEEGHD